MKKTLTITLAVLVAILLIVITVFFFFSRRITMNPDGTVGNTAGNLYNDGLFCEHDGTVYFANTYNEGGLFAMAPDESNMRRLNALNVKNLLAGGNYLYYFQSGSLSTDSNLGQISGAKSFNRCKLNGSSSASLSRDILLSGQLVNNHLYLMTTSGSTNAFIKVKIDGSERETLADYVITPACAANGVIYYSGTTDHYLHQYNTATGVDRVIWNGCDIWNPVVDGGYVYYMDVADNYRLCRYSLTQNSTQTLTEDRVDCFNLGGGYIYYQKNDPVSPQLKGMRMDGSAAWVVAEGNFTHINMTSQFVYFQAFGDDRTLYHSRLGGNGYEVFSAAMEAISLK